MAGGTQGSDKPVVTAASFVVTVPTLLGGPMAFSELSGINSKVDATEYIESAGREKGVVHTKQFGKTSPPTITLKRGLDAEGNKNLLLWHMNARNGTDQGTTGQLDVFDARGARSISYIIHNAWCQELTISGVKAGDSTVATVEVKIACTQIEAAT